MRTAIIQVGFSSSRLLILDDRRGPSLNLVWSDDGGEESPRGRADALLTQNGYRRVGDWETTRDGDTAPVEAGDVTGRCSCWWGERDGQPVLENIDYMCADHPELRERDR